jgi:hypothetical protein
MEEKGRKKGRNKRREKNRKIKEERTIGKKDEDKKVKVREGKKRKAGNESKEG